METEKGLILIVDDNKDNLRVVSSLLKGKGYEIALSLNAANAYQILETHSVDLILLDVMMPEEDGYNFCRRIKRDERFIEIPVVFLTALTEPGDLVAGFEAGGVDYITKPFRKEELHARVKSHVDLAHARRNIIEQAEVIRKINQTRDLMYSIISHDIRSPFASISMMVSMLAEGYLNPSSEEFEEIIQNLNHSTKETYALLENLLQWTRTQTGNIECNKENLSVRQIIENALPMASMRAEMKQITISTDIPEGIAIYADSNMAATVLRNLLSNAVKYTPKNGSVHIKVTADSGDTMIEVIDTGVGIDNTQLEHLFRSDVFHTTAGTNNEKGSGLGLHLVKVFMDRHNGIIEIDSEPGTGSVFRIVFRADTGTQGLNSESNIVINHLNL